ncbi:trypsin-1, partial [Eurytemora carolleeae]|uniref:trypsin-1 n=1 Tax=Eurytemora carolleeae TaxID=1294199 RepID=UPI000C77C1B1
FVQDSGEAEFQIEKVDFHENFNVGPYLNNDIAIAHIRQDEGGIKFGPYVGPVCLPSPHTTYAGKNVTISGWGKNGYDQDLNGKNFISKLQYASVPVIPSGVCRQDNVYGGEKISSGMFCAGLLEGGVDSCQGDSGGPAVLLEETVGGADRGVVVGLTSWGYGCGRQFKPGVYTRLSKYVPWIYEKIKQLHV